MDQRPPALENLNVYYFSRHPHKNMRLENFENELHTEEKMEKRDRMLFVNWNIKGHISSTAFALSSNLTKYAGSWESNIHPVSGGAPLSSFYFG